MDRYLAELHQPIKDKKKVYSSSSSSSVDETWSDSSDEEKIYYCRLCNKSMKSKDKEMKPENEICKNCISNFPGKETHQYVSGVDLQCTYI